MLSMTRFAIVASVLAIGQLALSAVPAADQTTKQSQDQWRYTFHNGEWWYWLPTNRWVYWRGNQWNDYDARTFASAHSSGVVAASSAGSASGSQAAANSDVRPFYGHSVSDLDRRPLDENGEAGPFYGHALPGEVFGPWRARRSLRPFYGHAISSSDQ